MGLFKLLQFALLLEISTIVLCQDKLGMLRLLQFFILRTKTILCKGKLICGTIDGGPFDTTVSCVEIPKICNSVNDCPNQADEVLCPINCDDRIRCSDDRTCAKGCDGIRTCPNGEDEETCSDECRCGPTFYLCSDRSKCIPRAKICNGKMDCNSGEDEAVCDAPGCRCEPGFAACMDGHTCVDFSQICNNVPNECPGNEDEAHCPMGCQCNDGEFFCGNGENCVRFDQLCNGDPHECCNGDASACSGNLNEDSNCISPLT